MIKERDWDLWWNVDGTAPGFCALIDAVSLAVTGCCETRMAVYRDTSDCTPSLDARGVIVACDGDLASYPIHFCPWCGRRWWRP